MKIAYNVKELTKVAEELRAAYEVRKYCLDYEENHPGDTLKMKPRCCSRWFFWLCCCDEKVSIIEEVETFTESTSGYFQVDVQQHYDEEIVRLEREVTRNREIALNKPLGIAYVTFKSINTCKVSPECKEGDVDCSFFLQTIYQDFSSSFLTTPNPPLSSLSPSLRPERWRVTFASSPRDIHWANLQVHIDHCLLCEM